MVQGEGIRTIIVSGLVSESFSDVKNNKIENDKNNKHLKHFLSSGVWTLRQIMSNFYMCRCYTYYKS